MDQILDVPSVQSHPLKYAGFWIRVAAYLIDFLILLAVQLALGLLIMGGFVSANGNPVVTIISAVVGIGYFTIMESSPRQATLGKIAVGIKVGKANREQLSYANALGRYFAKILSGLFLFIGFMMVGWDSKKQGLHDKLANTYVYYA